MLVTDHRIADFLSTLKLGLEWIADAGKKLVKILDTNPGAFEEILEECTDPWMSREVLQTIELIGRGKIAPETLLLPTHVATRLQALPIDQQLAAVQSVEVAVPPRNGKGTWSTTTKAAADLTPREAARAIGPNGLRSAHEQNGLLGRPKGSTVGKFEIVMEGKEPRLRPITSLGAALDYSKQRIKLVDGRALIELYL